MNERQVVSSVTRGRSQEGTVLRLEAGSLRPIGRPPCRRVRQNDAAPSTANERRERKAQAGLLLGSQP